MKEGKKGERKTDRQNGEKIKSRERKGQTNK